jgi:hypothetical protein
LLPGLRGIESTALGSTLAPVSAAKVTIAVLQIGMERVTTTNSAHYLGIDKSGTNNCTIRIDANGFNGWERKILVLQVGRTRVHSLSDLPAVSEESPGNAAQAAVELVSAMTESIIPETPLRVMPLTGLDESSVLISEVVNRSIERERII